MKNLPNEWEEVKLEKYIELVKSGVKKFNGKKRYIATGSIETGKIVNYEEFEYETRPSRANMEVQENDVLFAKMKDTEKVYLITKEDKDNLYSTGFAILRITNKEKIIPKYLYYWLITSDFQNKKNKESTGATQKAISDNKIKKFKILIPPSDYQNKIVSILDKVSQLKNWREKADNLTKEYLESVFLEMFRKTKKSETKKIGELTEVKTGKTPSRKNEDYFNGSIPWVKTTELKDNIICGSQEHITEDAVKEADMKFYPKSTILIAMYGQGKTMGRTAKLGIESTSNQACAAILPSNKINMDYLWYFLISSYKRIRLMGRGGNQPNLNLNIIKSVEVPFPDVNLQNKFASIFNYIQKVKINQEKSKQQIDSMFDSLIQRAFRGELVC